MKDARIHRNTSLGLLRQAQARIPRTRGSRSSEDDPSTALAGVGSDSGKRPRTRLAGSGAAPRTRGPNPACWARASDLWPTDPTPSGGGARFPATTSTRPACWLRAPTPRASSSIPRILDPAPSGVGVRGSGATSWKPLRWPTGRGPRTTGPQPACWSRTLQPPGASSESMDNRLESTSDGSKSASAADGTELTGERLGSTDEGRDSFGMTAPIPRMTCPAPSGEGHRLPGYDVRCRFAGGRCRLHGCALRVHGRDVRRQLAGRGLRVHG